MIPEMEKGYLRSNIIYPICSMYGVFTYIWLIFRANVGKCSIHGAYGYIYIYSKICIDRFDLGIAYILTYHLTIHLTYILIEIWTNNNSIYIYICTVDGAYLRSSVRCGNAEVATVERPSARPETIHLDGEKRLGHRTEEDGHDTVPLGWFKDLLGTIIFPLEL